MTKISSREYKAMLDHRQFVDRKTAIQSLWKDLRRVAKSHELKTDGQFSKEGMEKRTLRFLDTPDFTFRKNNLLLRYRKEVKSQKPGEYTLKCRTEDRYLSQGKDLHAGHGLDEKKKFEEDIGPPFVSRYSHSNTIVAPSGKIPETVAQAAVLFPKLEVLQRDGAICDGSTPLIVVNNFVAHERVYKGPKLKLQDNFEASVALILWFHSWHGRCIAAEFSFRYADDDENYPHATAKQAYDFFRELQNLDWCLPGAVTKTQLAYS